MVSLYVQFLALGLAYSKHLREMCVNFRYLECFLRVRLIVLNNNIAINYLVAIRDPAFYISYFLLSVKQPHRVNSYCPYLRKKEHRAQKGEGFLQGHSPVPAKPLSEPTSTSLPALNPFHKSGRLQGHLGCTERSLGMGPLIVGIYDRLRKLLEAAG